jgi:hypothetical protein
MSGATSRWRWRSRDSRRQSIAGTDAATTVCVADEMPPPVIDATSRWAISLDNASCGAGVVCGGIGERLKGRLCAWRCTLRCCRVARDGGECGVEVRCCSVLCSVPFAPRRGCSAVVCLRV